MKPRHRPLLKLVALGLVLVIAWVALGRRRSDIEAQAPKDPRSILSRVWFDHYPAGRADDTQIWIFLGGGIGLYEKGSMYRASYDIFEFERQGSKLEIKFLHDEKDAATKFQVTSCDEKPPFDLCLTFDDPPRGPKKLYSWGDDDERDARVPWAKDAMNAAQALAKGAK
jgi:hypothetical protein